MASFRQDVNCPEKRKDLNNSMARETTLPPVSKYSKLHATLRPTPLRMFSVSDLDEIRVHLLTAQQLDNMTSTTAEDRGSHLRFSREVGLEERPMPRSKHSLADIKAVIAPDPQEYSRLKTVPSPTRRHMLPGANLAPKKEAATLNRRKGSVPDLGLGPMTTVQEGCLDSRRLLILSWPEQNH